MKLKELKAHVMLTFPRGGVRVDDIGDTKCVFILTDIKDPDADRGLISSQVKSMLPSAYRDNIDVQWSDYDLFGQFVVYLNLKVSDDSDTSILVPVDQVLN